MYELLGNPRSDDRLARLINATLLLLIAANVAASILETEVELARRAPGFFEWFESISIVVFTAEYLLRLWSCTTDPRFTGAVRGRVHMAITPMALVDLAAIAPFYLELFLPGTLDLRFSRVLRLFRLFRLLRSPRIARAFATMVRVLQSRRIDLAVSLAIVLAAMLIAAGAIYVAERGVPDTQFTSIPQAMWWATVTITTIGYGDMVPVTTAGKLLGSLVAFIGISAVALPVGIMSSGFIEEINRKRQERAAPTDARTCPHCGGRLDG